MSDKPLARATAAETMAAMRKAGFADVSVTDRNQWHAELSAQEVRDIEGPLRARAVEILGEGPFEDWLAFRKVLAASAGSGSLRPTHLRAQRPT